MTKIGIYLKAVVEVIKSLNRLGHSVSLSAKKRKKDTALCLQKLAITSEGKVALPENLLSHEITMFNHTIILIAWKKP